ncbi:efflux transporter periplasmic adaptor subunit, partial [Pseudomonas aeruginosa]
MSTAPFRAKPIAISVIGLVVVFGLLYSWRTVRGSGAENHTMPPLPVSTIRAETRSVGDELQAVGS